MKTIWKFPLIVAQVQDIAIPAGARILTVQTQADHVCLWALVESDAPKVTRRIAVIGTGNPAPDWGDLKYIATFQLHGGALVFHAFEIVDALV